MVKTSIYHTAQIKEQYSRIFIDQFVLDKGWKCRWNDQDNDIDGRFELFDNLDNSNNLSTKAKFINIQLKSTECPDFKEKYIKYNCDIKFLNFCEKCHEPVVLVLFSILDQKAYCLFMQEYLIVKLDKENPDWRNNKTQCLIKIPLDNEINKFDFVSIFNNGIIDISQLNKVKNKCYNIIELSDGSSGSVRKLSAKLLVDSDFKNSKIAMREVVLKANEEIRQSDYCRHKNISKDNPVDVVFMFFYNSKYQSDHGLPFCKTQWISENLEEEHRPAILHSDDTYNNIRIQWDDVDDLDKFILENQATKGAYLKAIDALIYDSHDVANKIQKISLDFKKGILRFEKYKSSIIEFSDDIEELYSQPDAIGFPPTECNDLNECVETMLSYLQNINIVVSDKSRDKENVISCIDMYMNDAAKEFEKIRFERNKIV